MMTIDEFRRALDVQGSDLSQWPRPQRAQAERLLDADADARRAFALARDIDSHLEAFVRMDAGISADAAARGVSTLFATPLPRQQGRRSRWPAILLNLDFTPAWPRVAALACCAALGFVIGLSGLDRRIDQSDASYAIASRDSLGLVVFEPEPLTGTRP